MRQLVPTMEAAVDMAASSDILAQYRDLLQEKAVFGQLGTVMPDGSPQVTPIWFNYDGQVLRINSRKGSQKDRNMRRNPRVALCVLDPGNPYRYVAVRGRVIDISDDATHEHINSLSQKYTGNPDYEVPAGQVRVRYTIQIEHVTGSTG